MITIFVWEGERGRFNEARERASGEPWPDANVAEAGSASIGPLWASVGFASCVPFGRFSGSLLSGNFDPSVSVTHPTKRKGWAGSIKYCRNGSKFGAIGRPSISRPRMEHLAMPGKEFECSFDSITR